MRTRRNVYQLPAGDKTLDWFGQAVVAMRARAATDPLGWTYQAAIHGRSGTIPQAQKAFWAKCQHGTSFFLPWHRMYLLQFERIVAQHIVDAGGPPDWALPYWNYSAAAEWLVLPPAFQGATLANGDPNPLFVMRRASSVNGGEPISDLAVDLRLSMEAPGTTEPGGFFGGPRENHGGNEFGMLEGTVHNNVHVEIGGWSGWMSNPSQAALDPIFWLHHANIDRLWTVWLKRSEANTNLASAYWRTGESFEFHDATGAAMTMRTSDVLDTAAPALDYEYDDISDPFSAISGGLVPPTVKPSMSAELVGATTQSIDLGASQRHVQLPTPVTPQAFKQSSSPNALIPPQPASKLVERVLLRLENVTSQALAPVYDVYVNGPDVDVSQRDRYAGRAAMFGIALASDPAGPHGGGGQNYTFDITRLYHRLADAAGFDHSRLRISFVPIQAADASPVRIGRISLYFA